MDIKVKKRNGRLEEFNVEKINASAQRACEEIEDVSASEIVLDAQLAII
jgi:transcriptional regulator NrdR family protein